MNPIKFLASGIFLISVCHVLGLSAIPFANDGSRADNVGKSGVKIESVVDKLDSWFNDGVAPARATMQLMRRYHNWTVGYNNLKAEVGDESKLKDVGAVLKEEYTKADERLLGELDQRGRPESEYSLFEVLTLAIDGLESRLRRLREAQAAGGLAEALASESQVDGRRVANAMGHAINSGTKVMRGEMIQLAKIYLFNSLAVYLDSKPDTGDPIDMLRPIVHMLGSASTPLMISYLMTVQKRTLKAMLGPPLIEALTMLKSEARGTTPTPDQTTDVADQ